jgi:hypothetical protein
MSAVTYQSTTERVKVWLDVCDQQGLKVRAAQVNPGVAAVEPGPEQVLIDQVRMTHDEFSRTAREARQCC